MNFCPLRNFLLLLSILLLTGRTFAGSYTPILKILEFPEAGISINPSGKSEIHLTGGDPDAPPGEPVLPVVPLSFDLPEGCDIEGIEVGEKGVYTRSLPAPPLWGEMPGHPGGPPPGRVVPNPGIAGKDAFYPASAIRRQRIDRRGRRLRLSLALSPVRLNPLRRELRGCRTVTLTLKLKPLSPPPRLASPAESVLAPGRYTYLVVAPSSLLEASGEWDFERLCRARERTGHRCVRISTEWIDARYPGDDLPERLRNFLQEAHRTWGIRYLLLGGDFTLIPVKKLSITVRNFLTYKAEIPSDGIYYGCLDGPMDGNGNKIYGEPGDGTDGGDIDLAAELLVGRFPVSTPGELFRMVRKTLTYEAATPGQLRPVTFMGERINMGTQLYSSPHLEEIRLGSSSYSLETLGFLNDRYAPFFETDTLYDSEGFKWSQADALGKIGKAWQVINHLGHGAPQVCMKIDLSDPHSRSVLQAQTNSLPWILYSEACLCGSFDTPECFAEQIVTAPNAAVAAVMNAREGWLFTNTVGGQSHRFHRCFWDALFSGRGSTLGELNDLSRQRNLPLLGQIQDFWRWVYLELNVFGDPALTLMPSINPTPAEISHEPLLNSYSDDQPYTVSCRVEPVGLYDPEGIRLIWGGSGIQGSLHTQRMEQVEGNLFSADIPPQPRGSRIDYRISAGTRSGTTTLFPSPTNSCSFRITERLELKILGSPENIGLPRPDYGTHFFASGRWARVTAPERSSINPDERFDFYGHVGIGSAPSSPDARSASFMMQGDAMLIWIGHRALRTTLSATRSLFPAKEFWPEEGSSLTLPEIPDSLLREGILYRFSEWIVDGERVPAPPNKCRPDNLTLLADTPHRVEALYLPEELDQDGNGIQDWWERMFYGKIGKDPEEDEDRDGFTLAEEFQHWSDPTSAKEFPSPPEILPDFLPPILDHPAPYTLAALIRETREVVDPTLHWQIASEETPRWRTSPLVRREGERYTATFAGEARPGDLLRYFITAEDPTGWGSTSTLHDAFIAYPIAGTNLFEDLGMQVTSDQDPVESLCYLFNLGNAPLEGNIRLVREDPVTESTLLEWDWRSVEQPWSLSTNRTVSPPYSLHCRLDSSKKQSATSPVHGSITFPPSLVGPRALLSFDYWIHGEPDKKEPERSFDGGIVEYSLDDGKSFHLLKGPYTHTIYGWTSSPWPDGTPCFSGDGTEGWRRACFDLKALYPEYNGFAGRRVVFRFQMGGDNNSDPEGWYLDNIRLSPVAPSPAHDLEPKGAFSVGGGGYLPIRLRLFPGNMETRSETLRVEVETNDPVQPISGFFWKLRQRDLPGVNLEARQSRDGRGIVSLETLWEEIDGAPLSARIEGSIDRGKSWFPLVLEEIRSSLQTNLPSRVLDGHHSGIRTATNALPVPNRISMRWDSSERLGEPLLYTQLCFRASATSPWFTEAREFGPFTLDREPPRFLTGPEWEASGYTRVSEGCYMTAIQPPPPLTLLIPSAQDASGISSNLLTLVVDGSGGEEVVRTNLPPRITTFGVTGRIDCAVTVQAVARDLFGNRSVPVQSKTRFLSASGDFDGDGMSTEDEYLAGTQPDDPDSCLRLSIQTGEGCLQLSWPSVSGKNYRIEATPTLCSPLWREIGPLIPGTGFPLTYTLSLNEMTGFFRIKVVLNEK